VPPGGLLTLDLSTHVGWCYGPVNERFPLAMGTIDLPTFNGTKLGLGEKVPYGTIGHKGMSLQNDLIALFLAVGKGKNKVTLPSEITIERPLPPAGQTDTNTCLLMYGLAFLVYTEAHTASVPVTSIDVRSIRREVFGADLNVPRNKLKSTVLRLIRARGIPAKDHNQADAAAIWLCRKQRLTHGAGPLWEEYAA
jgi:hypothetical protein